MKKIVKDMPHEKRRPAVVEETTRQHRGKWELSHD